LGSGEEHVIRRLALAAAAFLAVLIALGIYPRTRHAIHRGWHILRGELVDVGGYRLRVECRGKGSPAVVLDSGLTFGRKTWDFVWPIITKFSRAFAYDRAGLGESERVPRPRTSLQIINDLHKALIRAHVPPPYVLVGHSFGGLNVRLYASYYPQEVVGLVLINACHEDQYDLLAAVLTSDEKAAYFRQWRGGNKEGIDVLSSAAEVRAAPPVPEVPTVVLSSYGKDISEGSPMAIAEWKIQQMVARTMPKSRHIVVENCGHFIQEERPELVVEAIRSVVQTVRDSRVGYPNR
jgi:pimeloyl-ACP methyl ester carboxylesterase